MIIDMNLPDEDFTFSRLHPGDAFFWGDELMMVVEEVTINEQEGVNTVSLENGSTYFIAPEAYVQPARVKIVRA